MEVMQLKPEGVKVVGERPELEGGKQESSLSPQREHGPADILTSDLQPPDLRGSISVVQNHAVYGHLLCSPGKLQVDLRDNTGSVPDHCNKAHIKIKRVT